jgi:hypothetical protein
MKVAIYNRGRQLAIREQPSADAAVIGTIGDGCAMRVEDAAPGWLELLGGGYINAAFVTVGTLMDETTYTVSERRKEPEAKPAEQDTVSAEPGRDEPEPDDDGDTLKSMKLNELRELAKGSGIALPKNATKAQIIELLMGSDE